MSTPSNKPVRGIDWKGIFDRRPDLKPPGYDQALREAQQRRLDKAAKSS